MNKVVAIEDYLAALADWRRTTHVRRRWRSCSQQRPIGSVAELHGLVIGVVDDMPGYADGIGAIR
ncbi:MAG: hypothetical protein KDE31_35495 [Caldilineaceae bacterium]|nr:hypothetical protein [Caldilineaceae bacterium]